MTVADDLATLREARRSMAASLIAVKGHLDEPYPDDPRWTPWTRFIERELQRLDEMKAVVDRVEDEIARLEGENALLLEGAESYFKEALALFERRAEAAEAEAARLRDLLAEDGAADADSTGDLDADLQAQGFDPFGSGGAA